MITIVGPAQLPRLRVRRVDEYAIAASAIEHARNFRAITIRCVHGGTVANAYRYRADTECVLVCALPHGDAVIWLARVTANKATLAGTANACLPGAGALYDNRTGKARRDLAWRLIVDAAKAELRKAESVA